MKKCICDICFKQCQRHSVERDVRNLSILRKFEPRTVVYVGMEDGRLKNANAHYVTTTFADWVCIIISIYLFKNAFMGFDQMTSNCTATALGKIMLFSLSYSTFSGAL